MIRPLISEYPPKRNLMYRFLLTVTFAVLPMVPRGSAAGGGIVIHKDLPLTVDEFAIVTEYRDMEVFNAVTNLATPSGTKVSLRNEEVVRVVPYPNPDLVRVILQEADLLPIKAEVGELTGLIQKYPRSAKFLTPHLRLFQSEIDRLRGGQAKFEGNWFPTRKALDDSLLARKEAAAKYEAVEKQRVEVLRLAEEKRRTQEAASIAAARAAAEQAIAQQERMQQEAVKKAREMEGQAEEARKIAEEKQASAARLEAQLREEERRQKEVKAAEERREEQLLLNAADRFRKVDRFRRDLTEPVMAH